jgi:phenylpropionate dioxygenase-like ring-hydroxylating dioxygenase large terminal subunit
MSKTIPIVDAQHAGSAYHHVPGHPDPQLSAVAKGTPTGEYLRRYWQPVALSADVTDRPQMVRIIGEDLVLFRDKAGRPGLLYPRCMHRGTSLYYGHVEEAGIRCCYHGWLFAVDGTCLNQPCEPEGGLRREAARQPWYPVEERYGLVFAYMGPPEKKPVLPRYDILEDLEEGEFIEVIGGGFAGYADHVEDPNVPYHWLQNWENIMDPYHVYILHSTFSGIQFAENFKILPRVDFEAVDGGVIYHAWRDLEDGRQLERINSALFPNISAIPMIDLSPGQGRWIGWHVAVDDQHFRGFFAARTKQPGNFAPFKMHNGKSWTELSEQEKQDFPGDFEAQFGQGRVTLHGEEHLATSDRGIALLRRQMKQQIAIVQQGGDPAGVHFNEADALVRIRSGNFYTTSDKTETAAA